MSKDFVVGTIFFLSAVLAWFGAYAAFRLSPHRPAPIRSLWEYIIRVCGFYRGEVSDADRQSSIKHERDWIVAGVLTFALSFCVLGSLATFLGLIEKS